ncbi:TetR/AcrR family transcriptional regulator [Corynebacterium sp.]|uniref:TetR/AcrR family transcriptional regulator n=1 Tax=Corynebacterium sp. TaxID=1720 RepID=UPI003B3A9299
MSTSGSAAAQSYHHGNLRQALIDAAVEMLEQGENFSLRAVARWAGVSQTAPYRHFSDRASLESAVAAQGFLALGEHLFAGRGAPTTPEDLPEFAVAYVRFAVERPRMFRLMFGTECDDQDDDRVRAAGLLRYALSENLRTVYPGAAVEDLATGLWSTAHGLASLHLDGKLSQEPAEEMYERVRGAFRAVLGLVG